MSGEVATSTGHCLPLTLFADDQPRLGRELFLARASSYGPYQ